MAGPLASGVPVIAPRRGRAGRDVPRRRGDPPAGADADLILTAAVVALEPIQVIARRLEDERIKIQPGIGASTYELTSRAIEA